jgi:hypothetical protein
LLITEKTSPQGLAIFDVLERSLIVLRWIEWHNLITKLAICMLLNNLR